ncbi:MAG: hypothetical protein ACREUX_18985 [Burkholderiales bacterium]
MPAARLARTTAPLLSALDEILAQLARALAAWTHEYPGIAASSRSFNR